MTMGVGLIITQMTMMVGMVIDAKKGQTDIRFFKPKRAKHC